jgi:GrxC family glutaredoxin
MAAVKIYTRRACGYCDAAIALLEKKRVAFEAIDATGDQKLRAWLAETTKRSTLPQIFIDDVSVGGYDDLAHLNATGELDRLLSGTIA